MRPAAEYLIHNFVQGWLELPLHESSLAKGDPHRGKADTDS